ncbi:MAG: nucleotidyl transferase AbiEii/AbiGii toxin family protein [Ignavibacteria bacterium]|nr:nucleotidyl transferase AbiEii/AbiGii toxin family protein [Ignavibacteria bacterium]
MIKKECFTKNWLDKIKTDFPAIDPTILEKTIYAFELLALLQEEGIEFVFKGGTSLLLLLPQAKRLSIDVDILLSKPKEKLEESLNAILKKEVFSEWVEDSRTESRIPKKHYKLFFNSVVNPQFKSYLLLDVLLQENPYPKSGSRIINSRFIQTDSEVSVIVPTINSILGDKLAAFVPNTTGISFGQGKEMQINKQLFDIGELFDYSDDIKEIKESFDNFVEVESNYREKKFTSEDVISDLFQISLLVSQINIRGGINNAVTQEFVRGIQAIRSHLIGGRYNAEQAKLYSAKTALLVSAFGKEVNFNELKQYDLVKINDHKLVGDLLVLERLKTILPESYYYWQMIQRGFQ